jgi:hypothetical protein
MNESQETQPKPEAGLPLGAARGSAAALKARIAKMRERRKCSSGHYNVHVDELHEMLSILEIIIERQEPPNSVINHQK